LAAEQARKDHGDNFEERQNIRQNCTGRSQSAQVQDCQQAQSA
jgi:hypothetical protein